MRLETFIERLPTQDEPPEVEVPQGQAFNVAPDLVPGYVSPTLTVVDWPPDASVVLIEAPGAVGKSAASAEIATRLKWPLVKAEHAQVGSYTLSGLIQDALGFTSTYIHEIALGRAGVVVDSLDEAHFRAGTENFLSFVENIQKVSGAGSREDRKPSVVLMSRSDTAELVRLAFADAELPLASVTLDFFEQSGAEAFISAYMRQRYSETGRGEYNAPLAFEKPFQTLRDDRFHKIASVLVRSTDFRLRDVWPQVADFLGYTPVLIALAESLAVSNPSAGRNVLSTVDQTHLLRQIICTIADREQLKFSERMRTKLQAILPAEDERDVVASAMYTPNEQCARLLLYLSGEEPATAIPATLPDSIRHVYDEAVRNFLPDHPFIKGRRFASVVFADHVAATACRAVEVRAALTSPPETAIEAVGPFFARFMSDATGGSDLPPLVGENLVEHLLWSWTQESELLRATASSEATIAFDENEGSLTCIREQRNGDFAELEFRIEGLSGALQLLRPLKHLTVATEQGVLLGTRGSHMQIGPSVIIVADEISIEAESLRIETDGGRRRGVAIAASTILANYLTKVEAGPDSLRVFAAEPPPRLRPFQRSLVFQHRSIPYERLLDLRAILTSFRFSTKGGLSVLAAKLEGKIVKENANRLAILHRLEEVGLVVRSGQWFNLDLNVLGELGFGLQDLKAGEPNVQVVAFLVTCHGEP
jgi:hypothetical protein